MFDDPYYQVAILSAKKSGKSVLISNIVKKCSQPGYSTVIVFASTILRDPAYIALAKYCKRKGIDFQGRDSIREIDSNGRKKDFLAEFIKTVLKTSDEEVIDSDESDYESEALSEDDYYSEEEEPHFNFNSVKGSKPIKFIQDTPSIKKEYPTIAPRYVLVFDDLSDELKYPSVQVLMRKNRHIQSMCIYSSQDARDVVPSGHRNMDAFCVFGRLDDSILEKIKKDAGLNVSMDTLMTMYRKATEKKYSFLTIDVPLQQYKICFDRKFNIISSNKNDSEEAN
jgi:hypothetical protein